jgi:RNA polymerase sigma-70 factor (ECF subfamily)
MIDYESLSEKELCRLLKEGDSEAFNFVYEKHNNRVKSFILSKCGDYLLAEEVAQITWIKVWKKIGLFQNKSKLLTWIIRIAFNSFYDYVRKRKREVFFEDVCKPNDSGESGEEFLLAKIRPEIETPAKNLEEKDGFSFKSKKFNKIMSSLSEEKQQIADLVLLRGMTYEEASRKANVPVGTVMSRVYYLRKELQRTDWDV